MEPYQEKAWDCLTEVEQKSLFLNISQGLSARKSGEILKVTHYKYLEIKARAEKFFKMFSDYFQIHDTLIRERGPLNERFKHYLYGSILKRLPKEEAIVYAGDSAWLLKPVRSEFIFQNMIRLKRSEDPWDKDLYKLIMEFDRWNDHRILPRILQAPSAYKRRSTKKDKVYLRYLHGIPDFKIRALVDQYWRAGKPKHRYYGAFLSEYFPGGYSVVPIKRDPKIVEKLTNLKIYLFEDQLDANYFGVMVRYYFERTANVKSGIRFWKEYRSVVERAINYRNINNMDFTCEALDNAYGLKRKTPHQIHKDRLENED